MTTRQMKAAKPNAVYIWPNAHFTYPRELAKHLGRDDLTIVSPNFFSEYKPYSIRRQFVLDHATVLTPFQLDMFEAILQNQAALKDNK